MKRRGFIIAGALLVGSVTAVFATSQGAGAWTHCGTPLAEADCPSTSVPKTTTTVAKTTTTLPKTTTTTLPPPPSSTTSTTIAATPPAVAVSPPSSEAPAAPDQPLMPPESPPTQEGSSPGTPNRVEKSPAPTFSLPATE
jgi:hypothetical protein